MADSTAEGYLVSPLYKDAMRNFQLGEWEKGFSQLNELVTQFPLEHDLRVMRQEMQTRSRIDEYEREDRSKQRKLAIRKAIMRVGVVALLGLMLYGGVRLYFSLMQAKVEQASQQFNLAMTDLDLTVRYRNVENLIATNKPEEAKARLQEILEIDSQYPGAAELMVQTDDLLARKQNYLQAKDLIIQGNSTQALDILKQIQNEDANYEDVNQLIDQLNLGTVVLSNMVRADTEYSNGEWEQAISDYQSIRDLDPGYQKDKIETRLYECYVAYSKGILGKSDPTVEELDKANQYLLLALKLKPREREVIDLQVQARNWSVNLQVAGLTKQAWDAISGKEDSLEALDTFLMYYNQAIKVDPTNQDLITQRDMAQSYIEAQGQFKQGLYSDAIQTLETIYSQYKDYARGSARQSLYEAYMARGRAYDASGQYELEVRDFQRAAQIAQESPGSILRLFESQVSVANATAKLGYYKDAVQVYQAAVDMSGIRGRTSSHQSQLLSQLDRADSLVAAGSYQSASRIYRETLANITELYSTQTVQINSVEDLIKYTNMYNSTLEAILETNGWSQSDLSTISGEIKVPYLP